MLQKIVIVCLFLIGPIIVTILGTTAYWPRPLTSGDGKYKSNVTNFFCENAYEYEENVFCQPANGGSSYAFLIPGLLLIMCMPHLNKENIWNQAMAENVVFFASTAYLCCGNLMFHAFCVPGGIQYDGSGMIAAVSFFVAKSTQKFTLQWNDKLQVFTFWGMLCLYFTMLNPFFFDIMDASDALMFSFYGFVLIELTYAATEEKQYLPNKYGIAAFLFFVVGYSGWIAQEVYNACNHESVFQWHAVWHVCTAAALFCLFMMHRTQTQRRTKTRNAYSRVDVIDFKAVEVDEETI